VADEPAPLELEAADIDTVNSESACQSDDIEVIEAEPVERGPYADLRPPPVSRRYDTYSPVEHCTGWPRRTAVPQSGRARLWAPARLDVPPDCAAIGVESGWFARGSGARPATHPSGRSPPPPGPP
jgi:hypothetical protein